MDINDLAVQLGAALGLTQGGIAMLVGIIVAVMKLANFFAHVIPNDATGWKGTLRKVCVVIGLYASSKVTSGTSVDDAAKAVVDSGAVK